MNHLTIVVVALSLSSIALADPVGKPEQVQAKKPSLTAAERQERFLKNTGGFISPRETMKGRVVLLNRQSCVGTNEIAKVFASFAQDKEYAFSLEPADGKPGEVTIEIVDDPSRPTMMAAPYDAWAMVNVAKLREGLKSEAAIAKFLPSRTRKMIMKAFSYATGSGGSQFPQNVMATSTVPEIDFVEERLPVDTIRMSERNLAKRGVTPLKRVVYIKACREGWAPQPTNEYQKAIWDKVHSIPDKPLKITYDKGKQKPVVK